MKTSKNYKTYHKFSAAKSSSTETKHYENVYTPLFWGCLFVFPTICSPLWRSDVSGSSLQGSEWGDVVVEGFTE